MDEPHVRDMIFYFEFLEKKRRKRKHKEAKGELKRSRQKALMKKRIEC